MSLHETRVGKTTTQATYFSGPNAYSTSVFNKIENSPKFLTDLEVRYSFTPAFMVALGANNLFDVYPNKLPVENRYLGASQYDIYSSQVGVNGGFYYLRATYKF